MGLENLSRRKRSVLVDRSIRLRNNYRIEIESGIFFKRFELDRESIEECRNRWIILWKEESSSKLEFSIFFFLEKIVLIRENYEIIRERVASNWNRRRW